MAAFDVVISSSAASTRWMARASCSGHMELFFAPRAERPQARVRREALARAMCRECPVVLECRQAARDNREYGFWGGESEEERHRAGYTLAAPIGIKQRIERSA